MAPKRCHYEASFKRKVILVLENEGNGAATRTLHWASGGLCAIGVNKGASKASKKWFTGKRFKLSLLPFLGEQALDRQIYEVQGTFSATVACIK